jgi:putative FmdB family regulatory protein
MPVYEYICQDCAGEFEKRVSFSEADQMQDCPTCGSKHSKKKISMFASKTTGASTSNASSSSSCGSGGGRFT